MEGKYIMLETERLVLNGLSPDDMNFIFGSLPRHEIMALLGHRSEEEYVKEEYKYLHGYASYNRSFLLFLLMERNSEKLIGRCGFHNWNKDHQRAEIGYVMEDEDYKQKGLMSEAVTTIIDFGFNSLQLNRIEALVGPSNEASIRILEKNGFQLEGVLREHFRRDDIWEDSRLCALLKPAYFSSKA
jgi:ribosomal-protein-alanine N-acetyltransferase